eukprot:CAMPEP_0178858762 /NCGR_PEP_ID=MMETSP0747-20121128/840_1 /TAXON_ID=913974 /ORGANISM="Nitzschia punctata, Strain CCMP561" /LENGTH=216 /DNA_ID=CAMNT_0020525085 /DNA_START=100 /DNA_END=750 /DNA_ORIENTATION=-
MLDGYSCLAFDPEAIMERSDLGVEGSLRFLEYHSVDFFTDISELSSAFSYFSDAIELLDRSSATGNIRRNHDSSGFFPYACASSIAGRAVANTNEHPAPNKFRQFSRPKIFDVVRNEKQNQILVDQLSRRLSTYHMSMSSALGGDTGTFVTESLPFLREIIPQEVDPFVNNLYSVAMQHYHNNRKIFAKAEDDGLKEQKEILGMDDIDEFESEEER